MYVQLFPDISSILRTRRVYVWHCVPPAGTDFHLPPTTAHSPQSPQPQQSLCTGGSCTPAQPHSRCVSAAADSGGRPLSISFMPPQSQHSHVLCTSLRLISLSVFFDAIERLSTRLPLPALSPPPHCFPWPPSLHASNFVQWPTGNHISEPLRLMCLWS